MAAMMCMDARMPHAQGCARAAILSSPPQSGQAASSLLNTRLNKRDHTFDSVEIRESRLAPRLTTLAREELDALFAHLIESGLLSR